MLPEKLLRTVEYENAYIPDYVDGWLAERVLGMYFDCHRGERPHQAVDCRALSEAYAAG